MSQADTQIPIDQSGAAYRTADNAGKKAVLNHHKANGAPAYAEAGIVWINDTATPWLLRVYDGADWITLGEIDATANTFSPYIGTAGLRVLNHATDTGSANAYAVAPVPAITAYVTGQVVLLKPAHASTAASTIAVSGLATKNIKGLDGTDPVQGTLLTTGVYPLMYDGTSFVLLSAPSVGIPQNSQSAAYTTVLADNGKHILHPSADTTARTFTIDSNANVAYPLGAVITFVNENAAGVMTIAITSDTMRLAGAGTTGSRTLAARRQTWQKLLAQPPSAPALELGMAELRFLQVLQNKEFTYALFKQLADDFNGDTFPIEDGETDCIQQEHLDKLRGFLIGSTSAQQELFFFAYGTEGRCLVLLPADPRDWSGRQIINEYEELIQKLKVAPEVQDSKAGGRSALAELLISLWGQWQTVSKSNSEAEFLKWLEITGTLGEPSSKTSESADNLVETLDSLDSVLLSGIVETESLAGAPLTPTELEGKLAEIWRRCYAHYASEHEAVLGKWFLLRGQALTTRIYPEPERRRGLYRSGFAHTASGEGLTTTDNDQ